MFRPNQIVETIQSISGSGPLRVFWVTIFTEDRDRFALELSDTESDRPIVPWVLRTVGFTDPNSLMFDLAQILELAKDKIESALQGVRQVSGVDLVLLARRELNLMHTSSPITIPRWFAMYPGTEITAQIQDITWSISVSVDDEASQVDDMRRILYDLDVALLSRLKMALEQDRSSIQSLWSRVLGRENDNIAEELLNIGRQLSSVENPSKYRPTARTGSTIVGRLWSYANRNSPDSMNKPARALAKTLKVNAVQDAPLIGVLNRMTNPIEDEDTKTCFYLIVSLRSACQLVTAAAHADSYPRFPVTLLRSLSLDVRRFLDSLVGDLES